MLVYFSFIKLNIATLEGATIGDSNQSNFASSLEDISTKKIMTILLQSNV